MSCLTQGKLSIILQVIEANNDGTHEGPFFLIALIVLDSLYHCYGSPTVRQQHRAMRLGGVPHHFTWIEFEVRERYHVFREFHCRHQKTIQQVEL
jgi:hypothetical protein